MERKPESENPTEFKSVKIRHLIIPYVLQFSGGSAIFIGFWSLLQIDRGPLGTTESGIYIVSGLICYEIGSAIKDKVLNIKRDKRGNKIE